MHDDTLLDKLDNYLLSKKVSEVYLIYLVMVGVIVFVIYTFVFPIAESFYQTASKNLTAITKNLDAENTYVRVNTQRKVDLNNDINKHKTSLVEVQTENTYVDNKLKELSYLLFNDQSWASFMDRITFLAKNYNINLLRIENDFRDTKDLQNAKIEQVLNIEIDSRGSFHNIIKFINALEESQLVVDVYESTIASNTTNILESNVKLAVWGMLY